MKCLKYISIKNTLQAIKKNNFYAKTHGMLKDWALSGTVPMFP